SRARLRWRSTREAMRTTGGVGACSAGGVAGCWMTSSAMTSSPASVRCARLEHFLAQVSGDQPRDLDEALVVAQRRDGARARKVDGVDGFHMRRARREHRDAVGKQDRLVEVVRDEQNRRAVLGPELQKFLLHQ